MTPALLTSLRDMALTRARVARRAGDWDQAREHLCLCYWCRGKLRQLAPRPWHRVGTLTW